MTDIELESLHDFFVKNAPTDFPCPPWLNKNNPEEWFPTLGEMKKAGMLTLDKKDTKRILVCLYPLLIRKFAILAGCSEIDADQMAIIALIEGMPQINGTVDHN